jgi:RNAse (barnase) inhibitor barstar
MKELILDGAEWNNADDFYEAFFRAVGAPSWHGRNFDALVDSIEAGQINAVEVPYRIVICNCDRMGLEASKITSDFVALIREIAARGCPVEIEAVNSK